MAFLSLPNEIILEILEHLDNPRQIVSVICVNQRLYNLLRDCPVRYNIRFQGSSSLIWAARNGRLEMVRDLLFEYVSLPYPYLVMKLRFLSEGYLLPQKQVLYRLYKELLQARREPEGKRHVTLLGNSVDSTGPGDSPHRDGHTHTQLNTHLSLCCLP
jgi:hypothetical protein